MKIAILSVFYLLFRIALGDEMRLAICFLFVIFFLFSSNKLLLIQVLKLFLGIFIIVLIASITGLGNAQWDYWRDFLYIIQVLIYFLLGTLLVKYIGSWRDLCLTIIHFAIISAVIHLSFFILQPDILGLSIDAIREIAGRGSDAEFLGFPILILSMYNEKFKKLYSSKDKRLFYIFLALSVVSMLLYFSRTIIISSTILFLSFSGKVNLRSVKFYILLCIGGLILTTALDGINLNSDIELLNKFAKSKEEVFSTREASTFSEEEINKNWRSYESYRAILFYQNGNLTNQVFGFGFGTLVDLGISIKLNTTYEMEKIPIFHNGYLYFLIKFGIIGVLVYVFFLLRIAFITPQIEPNSGIYKYFQRYLEGLAVVVLINTFTTSGLVNKHNYLICILLGCIWNILRTYNNSQRR